MLQTAKVWTPRITVALLAGYYSLGVAYEIGLMHRIDLIAIPILKYFAGYMGMAALMPIFQPYAAYAVRILAACAAAGLYDLAERACVYTYTKIKDIWYTSPSS